jgi:hypothetical protein
MSGELLSRRAALRAIGTGSAGVVLLPWLSESGLLAFNRIQQTRAAAAPKVLSASQFATLEAVVEAIIPADEQSAGAKDARVADYVDLLLSEVEEPLALQWMGGLAELDDEANGRFKVPFAKLDAAQTDSVLASISKNEADPQTPLEAFFVMAKHATLDGYYTSEIGIHRELRYKGNKFLTEFIGCRTEDGKDCPHCGQKPTEAQRKGTGR